MKRRDNITHTNTLLHKVSLLFCWWWNYHVASSHCLSRFHWLNLKFSGRKRHILVEIHVLDHSARQRDGFNAKTTIKHHSENSVWEGGRS